MSQESDALRTLVARFEDWDDAHLTLEAALEGLAPEHRGVRPPGLPHSIWARDPDTDLLGPTRHATEPHHTVLRALLVAQDHLAYHVGQIVLIRRLLEGR